MKGNYSQANDPDDGGIRVRVGGGPVVHKMIGGLRLGRTICGLYVSKANSDEILFASHWSPCPACAENRHYRDVMEVGAV